MPSSTPAPAPSEYSFDAFSHHSTPPPVGVDFEDTVTTGVRLIPNINGEPHDTVQDLEVSSDQDAAFAVSEQIRFLASSALVPPPLPRVDDFFDEEQTKVTGMPFEIIEGSPPLTDAELEIDLTDPKLEED